MARFGQSWPILSRIRRSLAGQAKHSRARVGPNVANIGRNFTKSVRCWSTSGQSWPRLGKGWPHTWPKSVSDLCCARGSAPGVLYGRSTNKSRAAGQKSGAKVVRALVARSLTILGAYGTCVAAMSNLGVRPQPVSSQKNTPEAPFLANIRAMSAHFGQKIRTTPAPDFAPAGPHLCRAPYRAVPQTHPIQIGQTCAAFGRTGPSLGKNTQADQPQEWSGAWALWMSGVWLTIACRSSWSYP